MNEEDTSETTDALNDLRREAEAAVEAPDLQERVRQLARKALLDRTLSLVEVREIMSAITAGIGSGLSRRDGEFRTELKRAMAGMHDALSSTAEAISLTLREAASQGRAFKDGELKESIARLKELEGGLMDGLKDTAQKSGGKLKAELSALLEHMKTTRTDNGERIRAALDALKTGMRSSAHVGKAEMKDAAHTAGERLSSVASGVLAALAESLQRQSDRLHR